ncbi:transposase, partial [Aeromonas caviae]|uniref:transposase n=1 Tax=Aeromonas caviae TaxID=648 RepID=UPI001CC816CF
GHWYISFQVEQETSEPIHPSGSMVGLDAGIAKLATLLRIPVNLNSDSGICEHHFRKVCGQGFCEQKLSFEGRH